MQKIHVMLITILGNYLERLKHLQTFYFFLRTSLIKKSFVIFYTNVQAFNKFSLSFYANQILLIISNFFCSVLECTAIFWFETVFFYQKPIIFISERRLWKAIKFFYQDISIFLPPLLKNAQSASTIRKAHFW